MNSDDLMATGQVTLATPVNDAACDGVVVDRWGRWRTRSTATSPASSGSRRSSLATPTRSPRQGIRIGSSESTCGRRTPATDAGGGTVRVTDADQPGRGLTFTVEDGKVTGFGAALDTQDCYG